MERPVALAFVNRGRWMATCPFGCLVGTDVDRSWFICQGCLNRSVDGRRIPCVWPCDGDVAAIEAALAPRPEYAQNWEPNESIGSLLAENVIFLGAFDPVSGRVAGDVGADHNRFPALLALAGARAELGA